jgi:hypothetical protein
VGNFLKNLKNEFPLSATVWGLQREKNTEKMLRIFVVILVIISVLYLDFRFGEIMFPDPVTSP